MGSFTVDVLQVRNSSYQIGRDLGEFYRNRPILNTYDSITKSAIDEESMKSVYTALAPHLLEELKGIADGLNISFRKAAAMFSGYDVPKTKEMGCSAILTKEYYVRNYDFSSEFYDRLFTLSQPKEALATAGYNLLLLGRHDGVNQEGLVAGLHFVSNQSYTKGISAWVAVRMVLDTCSTVDEATQLLKEIPHAACYNISIGDRFGDFAEVEISPDSVMVRRGEKMLSCVNHFQEQTMRRKNRDIITGSVQRDVFLHGLEADLMTHEAMFNLFKDPTSPLFFIDYQNLFGTLHTFSYSYKKAKILTTIAKSEGVLEIDLKEWVKGVNLDVQKMNGFIEADEI
ncbi:peptidase C45 [Oceanobacillus picturae]|uniref:Peptidase C45 n=1 Tax=Oceanobacillus picturae TaxID=171693 RepID=A0A0U9H175_9BACI|nr:C45 family peptidase [Oceanobacillus picturae]GAQ16286.1 peptidase C45 [Oceanobacillus picturae]